MSVNGASANSFPFPAQTAQGSQQPTTAASGQPFSVDGDDSASTWVSGPLSTGGKAEVLSSVQTTLPDGKVLGIERIAFSASALNAAASQSTPTDADKKIDSQMLSELKQLAGYFNFNPTAAEIQLGGTAAIDLKA